MSSRQLRKLQQQRELEQAKLQAEQEDHSENDEEFEAKEPLKASLFAQLSSLDDGDDEEVKELADEEDVQTSGRTPQQTTPDPTPKKAKPSKKKKKKTKAASKTDGDVQVAVGPHEGEGPDEIDAALEALQIQDGLRPTANTAAPVPTLNPEYEKVCSLLKINSQHLKVANEMRNLFGRTAADNHEDAAGSTVRGNRRRQRGMQQQVDLETALKGHHAPGKGLPELTLRRNIFIQGKDDWPRGTTGGLTMTVIDDLQDIDGTVEFCFLHDKSYNAVQQQFDMLVEMGEPQNLIGLLQRNPYHVSSLLQVSKIAKDQSDHALASELLERALFTFARASTSLFATKLSQGKARLDFARPENRELWLAGYHYIRSLIMKGTYRTALEWAKLLLSLDPEDDPYSMLLIIHHVALRAHESQYVIDFAESPMLRQWSPSAAHTSASLALAAMQLRDGALSRKFLTESIKQVPWLHSKLFQELNLDSPPGSIWGSTPRNGAENLFTELYIRQTKDLWNTPEATSLLVEVAHACAKVDTSDIGLTSEDKVDLNVARYVYLDNTPAIMSLVPSRLLHRSPNSDSDPLPPDHNIFSWPSQRALFDKFGRRGVSEHTDDYFDPLAALARLMPRLRGRLQEDGLGLEGVEGDESDDNGIERIVVDDRLRRHLEAEVRDGTNRNHSEDRDGEREGRADSEEREERIEQQGLARRVLDFIWGPFASQAPGVGSDGTDTDSEADQR